MQHEITSIIPLLNENGDLTEPGFARSLLPVYRRKDIKAPKTRIKEWDYYLVSNGRFALALTVDDNGYMGLDSISLLDFAEGWEITKSPMSFMPLGRLAMPETSKRGDVRHGGKSTPSALKTTAPAAASSPPGWTISAPRGLSLPISSFSTSRRTAWSSARPSTSPAISTSTRR